MRKQKQDSSIKLRQTTAKSCTFCSFCAFAEKNAVSLAKTDCKGALAPKKPCLTKSPKPPNPALAPKKPCLTKSPKPNPDTACRVPKRKPAYYPGNSAQAEFPGFGTWRLHKIGRFRCQNASPLKFVYFIKSRISLLF